MCGVDGVLDVPVCLQAVLVLVQFLFCEARELGLGEEPGEDLLGKCLGTVAQPGQVLEHEEPFVIECLQFVDGLAELGHLHILEGEFVIEHAAGLLVQQPHVVVDLAGVKCLVMHIEVEQCHHIHVVEAKVPVGPLGSLLAYGEGGVEEGTVFEELLEGVLHLHDELLAVLVLAIDIEYGLAVGIHVTHMLAVEEMHVSDDLLSVEQRVEEIDEQILVGRGAEYALEAKVGEQTYVPFFRLSHSLSGCFAFKITVFPPYGKRGAWESFNA